MLAQVHGEPRGAELNVLPAARAPSRVSHNLVFGTLRSAVLRRCLTRRPSGAPLAGTAWIVLVLPRLIRRKTHDHEQESLCIVTLGE